MEWNEVFGAESLPAMEDIREFTGSAQPLWDELTAFIEGTYRVKPHITYSKCSAQPGWNVKYRKGSRSLCTLYPLAGSFIALVVVGPREEDEVRMGMEAGSYTEAIKKLYEKTTPSAIGRWLMIPVKENSILTDIRQLLAIRIRP